MRILQEKDFDKKYHQLLSVLTHKPESQSRENFLSFIHKLSKNENHQVWVLEDDDDRIIATITFLIEDKSIHGGSKVLHVEDVIVYPECQRRGIGKKLLKKAMDTAREKGCYKIILDCTPENMAFYIACGFLQKQVQMSFYLGIEDDQLIN
jgi:glucosamine-phosphate N-acetyltransferase